MRTETTPGQTSDYLGFDLVMADNLPEPRVLLADRGYDTDRIRKKTWVNGPSSLKFRCVWPRKCGSVWTTRFTVCATWSSAASTSSSARRVATRYDKTAESFLGFFDIASIRLWLGHLSTCPLRRPMTASSTFVAARRNLSRTCKQILRQRGGNPRSVLSATCKFDA